MNGRHTRNNVVRIPRRFRAYVVQMRRASYARHSSSKCDVKRAGCADYTRCTRRDSAFHSMGYFWPVLYAIFSNEAPTKLRRGVALNFNYATDLPIRGRSFICSGAFAAEQNAKYTSPTDWQSLHDSCRVVSLIQGLDIHLSQCGTTTIVTDN
jgi:hypothetical protein